jgi:hypothetical protein
MKNDRIKNDRIKSDRIKSGCIKGDRIKTGRIKRITDPRKQRFDSFYMFLTHHLKNDPMCVFDIFVPTSLQSTIKRNLKSVFCSDFALCTKVVLVLLPECRLWMLSFFCYGSEEFRLVLEATVGQRAQSDIAIDDVSLTPGCK